MIDDNDPPRPTKVFKLEVLVVDHDDIGADGIKSVLESQRYPNRCMNPKFVSSEERTVGWTDAHPLNRRDGWREAFNELFAPPSSEPITVYGDTEAMDMLTTEYRLYSRSTKRSRPRRNPPTAPKERQMTNQIKIDSLETTEYYPGLRVTTRYGHLSRGKSWGRLGTGSSVEWAPKNGSAVTLPSAGKWTVGSTDGFNRKDQDTYTVAAEAPAITDDQIAEVRATATVAEVIEACDAATDGDVKARRKLSRCYAEAIAAERKLAAAERKAARAARAAAEATARAGTATGAESVALDAEIEGRTTEAAAIRATADDEVRS